MAFGAVLAAATVGWWGCTLRADVVNPCGRAWLSVVGNLSTIVDKFPTTVAAEWENHYK